MKRNVLLSAAVLMCVCSCQSADSWQRSELDTILGQGDVMRVLRVQDASDSLFLRRECSDIPVSLLSGDVYKTLENKMIATVTSPEQDGVGIAGPQVGLSRRVVAVMRYDKDGEPFEVYPNIRVAAVYGETEPGSEGCLSVPGRRGIVERYQEIDIIYTSKETLRDTTERIKGFTAVIFQHECDHLDGVLYTDRLQTAE